MKKDSLPSFLNKVEKIKDQATKVTKEAVKTAETVKHVVQSSVGSASKVLNRDALSKGIDKTSKGIEMASKGVGTVAKTMEKASQNLRKLNEKIKK